MFTAILAWVQAHILNLLFQAAIAPETGLISLLAGPEVDLRHLHRFNREFWSLLQIVPDGMPYHGTMVASMSVCSLDLPPTGFFAAMLESLAFHPLLRLCFVIGACTLMSFTLTSSELSFGLYAELSLAIHKAAKLIRRLPACTMIKPLLGVLSPKMIYGTGAIIILVNFLQAYTPTDSYLWDSRLGQPSTASTAVPDSIMPIIFVVILLLLGRYLAGLQGLTSSQMAEIKSLMAKLEASESANNELRGQAQHDRRKESRKLATMFNGAMLILGITNGRLAQLVERSSTEASRADAATTELREANTVLLDSVKEKDVTIAYMSTEVNELRAAKAQDDSTIASVRRQNADLHDRINIYAETSADLRAEVDSLTLVKETLAARASKAQKSSELKSQRLTTLGKEAVEKDDKIKSLQDRVAALEAASAKSSTSTQSQTRTPPANVGLAAWNNFNIVDAERQEGLRREAASRAAEDAKKGITHEPVEPTFSTSYKQVTIGPNGERKVRKAVKGGADTTGSADSGPAAELPSAPPPASPLPASTTPTAAGAQPAIPNTSTAGPSTAVTQQTLCRDFMIRGSCRFGDKCRFAHVEGQVNDNNADAQAGTIPRTRAKGAKNIPKKDIMCPHLLTQGECKYGNKCRFAHVATDKTVYSGGMNASGHKAHLDKAKK